MRFNLFVGGWQHIQENKPLSSNDILGALSASPVFSEDGLELIGEGLKRFFSRTATSVRPIFCYRMWSVRCATSLVYWAAQQIRLFGGESGVMQERNMNETLGDPAVQTVLPENFQRRLQILFASRLGFNLRNVIAHGLLPASQFSILTSLMSLQVLLLMSLDSAMNSEKQPS
jgi:hypothetical protein